MLCNKKKILFLAIISVLGFGLYVNIVHAQGLLPPCAKTGDCTLDDFLLVGVNVANIIMKIVGAIALVMFIVGGIWWLQAAGRPEAIKRGRNILIGAIIGLCFVFFSWFIVRAIQDVIGVKPEHRIISWGGTNCQSIEIDGELVKIPEGTACGETEGVNENKICKEGKCIDKCEAFYGDKGYECKAISCLTNENFDDCLVRQGCFKDLCPPQIENNVCCKK